MFRALSLVLAIGLTSAVFAKADQLGCTVLLCTNAGPPPSQSIPESVQPETTAYWMTENGNRLAAMPRGGWRPLHA
jgi:hypothetical protein